MAWLYVPGAACLKRGSGLPWTHSDTPTALFVTSSGKPTRRPSWWPGWRTRPWSRRLSGTTLRPSAAAAGVASWISSLEATRASHSAPPDGDAAPPTPATCGPTSSALLARCGQASAFSRTSLAIFTLDFRRSGVDLKTWATALRRACSERMKSAPDTGANGCSSWPTARAADGNGSAYQRDNGMKGAERPTLAGAAAEWPTPAARDFRAPNSANSQERRNAGNKRGQQLQNFVEHSWPTPKEMDSRMTVRDADLMAERRKDPRWRNAGCRVLAREAAIWPTPMAKDGDKAPKTYSRGNPSLPAMGESFHCSPPAPATPTLGPESSPSTRRLNPRFVEWLMGWPIGWTDCGSAATGLCRYRRLMRSSLLALLSRPTATDGQGVLL